MLTFLAAGERTKALESYDKCRITLKRELGIEPESRTQALAALIRSGKISPAFKENELLDLTSLGEKVASSI